MKKEISAFDLNELKELMKKNNISHLSKISNGGGLCLSNHGGIAILINSSCDGLFYQYYNNDIKETEIEHFYKEELDNDSYDWLEEETAAGFKIDNDIYLLSEFIRNDC